MACVDNNIEKLRVDKLELLKMKRQFIVIFIIFLFQLSSVQSSNSSVQNLQPLVAKFFDEILVRTLQRILPFNVIFHVNFLHDTIKTEYSTCYSETMDYSVIRHEPLKPLCGRFGYIGPHEIFLTWTIPHLHPSATISLTVVYMDLPFVALGCKYANLTLVKTRNLLWQQRKLDCVVKQLDENRTAPMPGCTF